MTELTENTVNAAGSGACELTNQSSLSIQEGAALKRQEHLRQRVDMCM